MSSFHWTELPSLLPAYEDPAFKTSNLIQLNASEFITAPYCSALWQHSETGNEADKYGDVGLFKFNIQDNKWSLFMPYSPQFSPRWHQIGIDSNTHHNKIYVSPPLTIVDVATRTFASEAALTAVATKFANDNPLTPFMDIGRSSMPLLMTTSMVVADGVCHMLGCGDVHGDVHYANYAGGDQFALVHQFNEFVRGDCGCRLVHIRSQRRLLLFGGCRNYVAVEEAGTHMWSFALQTRQWSKLPQYISFIRNAFDVLVTSDEKYAIFFVVGVHSIVVLNLQNFEHVLSPIQVPCDGKTGFCKAVSKVDAKAVASYRYCAYCHAMPIATSLLRCSGCQSVYYCHPKCQRAHWKLVHKKQCKRLQKNKNDVEDVALDLDQDQDDVWQGCDLSERRKMVQLRERLHWQGRINRNSMRLHDDDDDSDSSDSSDSSSRPHDDAKYRVVQMKDTHNNLYYETLVCGFIRRCTADMLSIQIPHAIYKLVIKWCSGEAIYLMSNKGRLWKIAMNDIFDSCDLLP